MKRLLTLLLPLLAVSLATAPVRADGNPCPTIVQKAAISITTDGDATVIAADPGKKIVVWQLFMVNGHATTDVAVTIKEGSTSISGAFVLKANGGAATLQCTGTPWAKTAADAAFILNASAAGSLKGTVYYTLEQ